MEARKFILLLLPTLVAFLVGGYGAEIFGYQGFFWPGAIAWGAVIFIIDYNFTMIEKLGTLGVMGRVLLILSSALITATVGDHILFKDTIAERLETTLTDNPEYTQLLKDRDKLDSDARKMQSGINKLTADYVKETSRPDNRGVGPVAKGIVAQKTAAAAELEYLRTEKKSKEQEIKEFKAEKKGKHDIIKEIQVLYDYIFSQTVSTVIFFLLSAMVICIETLPLLLKSGKTRAAILRKREQAMWRTIHRNL